MSVMARMNSWMRAAAGRPRLEREMEAEMTFHLESRAADLENGGASRQEAARRARIEFGGVESVKDECRQSLGLRLWDDLRGDLHYALRTMRKHAGFSMLAVLCLTVAIAANATVFSWIEGILLRPFPLVQHQDRMMAITGTRAGMAGAAGESTDMSWPDFQDLAKNSTLFDWFIVDRIMGARVGIGERATSVTAAIVSANYFDALGVRPMLGRGFGAEEDYGRNAHPVTVISYQLWQEHFGRDPNIVGRTQILNGRPHTIIGVAPKGFYGTFVGWAMQLWVPVSMQETFDSAGPGYKLEDRGARWIEGYARVKPGVSREQGQQEVSAIMRRLEQQYPEVNRGFGAKLFPLRETPFNNAGALLPTLGALLAVSMLVLLIACANVSNLLLVRAFARRQEMTVRLSLGAARSRLVRQLLTEGLVLSIIAAAGGFVLAHWCRNLLAALLPRQGMLLPGEIDWRVLLAGAAICIVATLLVGIAPALQGSKVEIAAELKTGAATVAGSGRGWMRSGLVLAQVALSFVLLTGAGLLVRSLGSIRSTDPGFDVSHTVMTILDLTTAGYTPERAKTFQDAVIDRLQSATGIQSAVVARKTPFTYQAYSTARIATDSYQAAPNEQPTVVYNEVGPGYLATMGIPLLEGREFTREDNENAQPVAIVNQAMAAKYWPHQDPMGLRLQVNDKWIRVIGVAKTAKYNSITEDARPFFYVPMRQNFSADTNLNIRTSLDAQSLTKIVGKEIAALDPNVEAYRMVTMKEIVGRATGVQRTAAIMIAAFGGLAMLLAAVGLYSVMAYSVTQRRRELGVRMALGAGPGRVLRLIMRGGMALACSGLVLGIIVALASTRLLGYLLYRVSPRDPLAFASAGGVMLLCAVAACVVPAWRATRTDPVRALRV